MDISAPNTTRASSRNRGAHLTTAETRDIASALGGLIIGSVCDEGRIHLNPIIQQLSDALGKPCALNNFNSKRREMIKRLADFYAKDVDQIFKTHNRLGTWVIPQLAVLCVCYFWADFQIHANDVYHRYITSDVTLALEVANNAVDDQGAQRQQPYIPEALKLFLEDQKEERRQHLNLQLRQIDLQRQQITDQKDERKLQMDLQRQQIEDQKDERKQQIELQRQQILDQREERKQQIELQRLQVENQIALQKSQLELQRQQMEDQKAERAHQMEMFRQMQSQQQNQQDGNPTKPRHPTVTSFPHIEEFIKIKLVAALGIDRFCTDQLLEEFQHFSSSKNLPYPRTQKKFTTELNTIAERHGIKYYRNLGFNKPGYRRT